MATERSTQARKTAKTKRATTAKPKPENNKLLRPIEPLPAFVRTAFGKRDSLAQYRARPDYQRNDYLRWIAQASAKRHRTSGSSQCWTSSIAVTSP